MTAESMPPKTDGVNASHRASPEVAVEPTEKGGGFNESPKLPDSPRDENGLSSSSEPLVPREFLDRFHSGYSVNEQELHRIDIENRFSLARIHDVFSRHLPQNEKFRFVELGCAPAAWLHHFSEKFGYRTFGLDISHGGCLKSALNLKLLGASGHVVCGKLENAPFRRESFDVVFSSSLIEHFRNTDAVLRAHWNLLKPGGFLVLIVPNFSGLNLRFIRWKFKNTPFLEEHHFAICESKALQRKLDVLGVKTLFHGLCGTFYPDFYCDGYLNDPRKRIRLHRRVKRVLDLFPSFESRLFSPFIIHVSQKAG